MALVKKLLSAWDNGRGSLVIVYDDVSGEVESVEVTGKAGISFINHQTKRGMERDFDAQGQAETYRIAKPDRVVLDLSKEFGIRNGQLLSYEVRA